MESLKINALINILFLTLFISCLPQDKTKKHKHELELTATLGGINYLDTTSTIHIATTLFNPTTDTLSFITMSCSYEELFLSDTIIFKVQSRNDCFSNYPMVKNIPPGEKLDQFIMINQTSKDTKYMDNKLRVGMYLLTPKKEGEFGGIIKQYENRQNANIIWSNELDLNRLYRKLYK